MAEQLMTRAVAPVAGQASHRAWSFFPPCYVCQLPGKRPNVRLRIVVAAKETIFVRTANRAVALAMHSHM